MNEHVVVTACWSGLQRVAECCRVIVVCYSMLQCVAVVPEVNMA